MPENHGLKWIGKKKNLLSFVYYAENLCDSAIPKIMEQIKYAVKFSFFAIGNQCKYKFFKWNCNFSCHHTSLNIHWKKRKKKRKLFMIHKLRYNGYKNTLLRSVFTLKRGLRCQAIKPSKAGESLRGWSLSPKEYWSQPTHMNAR